ncbi:hemicentin-1-like [Myxocyprinus asiaticus]|uniref:hemicentin-1-like n=1 Tax=Myxocyprinus asiaticus TaxID=70543 RepID=UPI00222356BA|nr:hemicentin-1-like [Myxocyprinus asiaticus]
MQKRALFLTTTFRIFERRKKTFESRLFRCFRSFLCFSLLWLVAAGTDLKPCHSSELSLNPPRVVRKYNSSVSVNCSTTVPHGEMGWEATEGSVPMTNDSLITWNIQHLRQWDIEPICYINYNNGSQCESRLPITIYKTPDSVSISTVDHTGPVIEGKQYKLQCDIQNVAPVNNLTVKWFKGETLVDLTTFSDKTKTPVSESATLLITANRTDDGVQYRCEAELELGPDGPQPPPTVTSEPFNITVHFKPIINDIKLPYQVSVFRGYPVVLVCEAEGHPKPTISWKHTNSFGGNLTIPEATYETNGIYYCTASNYVGTIVRPVTVVVRENYWHIIVAVIVTIVAVISVLLCIYFIYNKNAKKGYFSPRSAQPNAQNGHRAQPAQIPYISIKIVNHIGPMIEGKQYKLQCDIQDMASVKSLIVKWFKGETLVNLTTFNDNTKTPVSESATLLITANRTDDGVQYRCEAEMELVAEGPQHSRGTSKPLNITVHVKPIINETKLAPKVPVFRGYLTVLVCEAEGYPKPTISWGSITNVIADGGNLTITEETPENIYCIASNSAGTTTRNVTVVLKEDHLPLIAGLVAITVAFISVIFIFIYSIYYKKAKMGQYSLKDAKPSAQNGNIAQNGKDNTIPMKKLSQSKIPIYRSSGEQLVRGSEITLEVSGPLLSECPVQLNPPRAVARYASSVSVNCSTNVPHGEMGWEATEGSVPMTNDSLITWNVQNLRQWDIEPICYINYNGTQCESRLPVTIYKTPDSVKIKSHIGPFTEGTEILLLCDIQNVAPVNNLTVKWFKGETLVDLATFSDKTKTPVSESATLLITANRTDDGVQYRCEAELKLGPDGPQPPPRVTSEPLKMTVHYKPKHSSSLEIIKEKDGTFTLNCTVVANPAPTYTWQSTYLQEKKTSSVLSSSTLTPGNYTCTATNFLGESSKVFIIEPTGRTTFWVILSVGLGLGAVLTLLVSYSIYKSMSSQNYVI